MRLEWKVAVITGAGRAISRAIAERSAAEVGPGGDLELQLSGCAAPLPLVGQRRHGPRS